MTKTSDPIECSAADENIPIPVLFARIGRHVMRQLGEALEPTGLRPRHVMALAALRGGALLQAAVGEAARVDAATLVGLLNELETLGLVVRRRNLTDRRRHVVEISELGRARLASVDRAAAVVESRFTAGLDTAQQAYLRALLARVITNAEGA